MLLTRLAPSSPSPSTAAHWTCSRCLRLQLQQARTQVRRQRRLNTTAAATAASKSTTTAKEPFTHLPPTPPLSPLHFYGLASLQPRHDDSTLRKVFDDHKFWAAYSRPNSSTNPTGIVGNRHLTHPEGFLDFASITLERCQRAVQKVSAATTLDDLRSLVKDLDRLSDLLCRVIDLADFVRASHPDRRFQLAANKAYAIMFQYMNQLNTTTVLNDRLKQAAATPKVYDSWSEQERVVAHILMEDFSRSAIDLPDGVRERFVHLNDRIAAGGTDFVDKMGPETQQLLFDSKQMTGLDPTMVRSLTSWGKTKIRPMHHEAQMALRYVDDADVRRDVYMAARTASKSSIARLEQMLEDRGELARLSGFESYAHMTLENKMAKSPEAVDEFLAALAQDNRRQVSAELQEMIELKEGDAMTDNFPNRINAWDKLYYTHKLVSNFKSERKLRTLDSLSAYFSVGTVMQGLSRLFDRLYGLRLVPRETQPGETWHDGVRRLDVISDTEGHVAVLYCDLFSRAGKSPNPAHFTLRCSREIGASEIQEMSSVAHPFSSSIEAATDGMAVMYNKATDSYFQLPTIALICDFPTHLNHSRPALLNFAEVKTLFHEMGHAVHSFLGRTALQNVAGTRCATDFAELPSVLMEHFAACPSVLGLYARHWETDAPLPMAALESRLTIEAKTQPTETEAQILLAMLDQAYHSALALRPDFDSTKLYLDVYNRHSSIQEPQGTAWQGFFGHLFGYGATYYSYLFDRAIAGKIWADVFQKKGAEGSIDRVNGELYKNEVLSWAGSRDGWKCVAGVLGDARLAQGGKEAMREVGKWGIRESP